MSDNFYIRYYVGHRGMYGHEFLEFEITGDGRFRYANNSKYKNDETILREVTVSPIVVDAVKKIVLDSEILKEDDKDWPLPDKVGKQELEIIFDDQHICFNCTKLGSILEIQNSRDPDGLTVFYYLIQDLKCFVLSLISAHFKVQPIQK